MIPHSQLGEVRTSNCLSERAPAEQSPADAPVRGARPRSMRAPCANPQSGTLPEAERLCLAANKRQ